MADYVDAKCIISGDVIEFYEYERGYVVGSECPNPSGRGSDATQDDKEINRMKVSNRARKTVRRLINANIGQYGVQFTTKFLTLTFADNIIDPKEANYEFKKFIKRMNYEVFNTKQGNLRYVAVIEFTKKGRVHYHLVLFNIPYVKSKELEKIWSNGFIKINKINHVDNVGAYVTKYMTKDNDKLIGNKSYFSSRNLIKPVEITERKKVENLANSLPEEILAYETNFDNDYVGSIRYRQYNIKRQKNV